MWGSSACVEGEGLGELRGSEGQALSAGRCVGGDGPFGVGGVL